MRFALKAVDASQAVVALDLEAADEAAVRDLARQRGYSVLALARRRNWLANPFPGRRRFPLVLFSLELVSLLDAGLNIVESLQTLCEKEPVGENRRLLEGLLSALQRGESPSRAFEQAPDAFSTLYVATVRASERTGNLKEALQRYLAYEEDLDKVRRKVVSAMIYPAILMGVGALVVAFLLTYVIPRFARVYEDISTDLPFFSSLLLALGRGIERHGAVALAAVAILATAFGYCLSSAPIRAQLMNRLWRLPVLGERMKIYQLARFYRTVGMLLCSGIPALRALEMVSSLLAANLRAQLAQATASLSDGQSISVALTAAGLATPVASRMMAVGERSGQMGELLERIARFYDDDTARHVDAFVRIFEPVLMAFLGAAVGGIVVLMYMPIFELAGSLQ